MAVRTSDRDTVVFKGSAEGFDDVAGKFGEFVEEENSSVRERNFTGGDLRPTPDDRNGASGMMWCTKRASSDDGLGRLGEGMKFGDFDLFSDGGRREEIHGGSSEHGFARAGRTREENIVMPGNGDREGAFGEFLTLDIVKNWTFE